MPSNHHILCCPLLLPPSTFPSTTADVVLLIRWPKYWSFTFSINPSNEYSGLISFKIDLFDLLAVQGTFKSLLQHQSSKASILWHSDFFMGFITWRISLIISYWLIPGRTFEGCIWILMGVVLWILPILVGDFLHEENGSWFNREKWSVFPEFGSSTIIERTSKKCQRAI